jgi:hypothetical protein
MSIVGIKWKQDGLCGAACAQMVLHARGLIGTTQNEQDDLWAKIQANTHGQSSAGQAACTGVLPVQPFYGMIRDACDAATVKCWCTHPNALKLTLKERLPVGVPLTLSKIADEDLANKKIITCLNRGGLAIVLINNANHWVVVDSWDENASEVEMIDPAVGEPAPILVNDWINDHMSAVDCAGSKLDGKYVILQVG